MARRGLLLSIVKAPEAGAEGDHKHGSSCMYLRHIVEQEMSIEELPKQAHWQGGVGATPALSA